MTVEELLNEHPEVTILDGLNDAIIGIDTDEHVVYSYDKIVEVFIGHGMTMEEAIEYTDYNVIRALPYMQNKPYVVYLTSTAL